MIVTRESSEAEMIAEFLRQESAARDRYGVRIDACLREEGVDAAILTNPDVGDPAANTARRRVFARYRGYGTGKASYLTGFPDSGVAWAWWAIGPDELLRARYIRYSYWTTISGGTRSSRVAAERIRRGVEAYGVSNGAFLELAERLRQGLRVPPLILVTAMGDNPDALVVLEGHARITAYALAPGAIPNPVEVLVGSSPAIAGWDEY